MIRRGGGITLPPRQVSWKDTKNEILFFATLYAITSAVQIVIILGTALLIGTLSGVAFLALAMLLEFKPRLMLMVEPLRCGAYLQHAWCNGNKKPGYVRLAQGLLTIAGIIAIGLLLTDHYPLIWQWRIGWNGSNYIMLSRWLFDAAGEWYVAQTGEILARVILVFAVPFTGWGATTLIKWASEMEVIRPTARESTYGVNDPGVIEGPRGEEFRGQRASANGGDDGGVVVIPPEY